MELLIAAGIPSAIVAFLFLVVGEANPRTGGSRKERTGMQAERTG